MNSNLKCYLFGLGFLAGTAVPNISCAQAPIIHAGSDSLEERVISLERISNGQGQILNQLHQKVLENQHDANALSGQIEEYQYQLHQIAERQKQIDQQIDKLSQENTRSREGQDSSFSGSRIRSPIPESQSNKQQSDYDTAVSLVMEKKQYDLAISTFEDFLKKYPRSIYRPNANYWLGQLLYHKGKKADASYYFSAVVKNYADSPKASDAMYKIGIIMSEKGEIDKARSVFYTVIRRYPSSVAASLARSRIVSIESESNQQLISIK